MAMEKLILRSILYGTDKIPDKWFDKVPGGFFRDKEANKKSIESENDRRNSIANDGRNYRDYDDYDEGYRSEGRRRRHQRSRSSYDGGADEDDYYISGDDERRRRRSGRSHRRRHSVDHDWRGYDEGRHRNHHGDRRDPYEDCRSSRRHPDPYSDRERPSTGGSDRARHNFAAGAATGAAAANAAYARDDGSYSPRSPSFSPSPRDRNGSIGNGYMPYSNIYGERNPDPPQQPFSPPPASSVRSPQPNSDNMISPPMAPPPQGYRQNPFAQEAPTAADAGAGAAYTGDPRFTTNQDPRWANEPDPNHGVRQYNGYDENEAPYPDSASPRRSSRRDHSPSYDSYDSRAYDRRSRSERRPDDDRSKPRGKSLSRLKEKFDTTERGLGYGAVGAVAGGLIGSEFGKGAVPTAIGATVGALGANAFEAREKYVYSQYPPHAQMPTQPPPPSMNRRKDGRRDSEYQRDGTYDRRDTRRRREEGYYSN